MTINLSTIIGSSFIGSQGIQGLQGAQGLQGLQGLSNQGVQGTQGIQGTQGLQGLQGFIGNPTSIPQITPIPSPLTRTIVGTHISTTSNVSIPSNVFLTGDVFSIYNSSQSVSITISQSGGTLYQAGTTNTGNRTLSTNGICTILCVDGTTNKFVISGQIVT
jgi:hypothetical protein